MQAQSHIIDKKEEIGGTAAVAGAGAGTKALLLDAVRDCAKGGAGTPACKRDGTQVWRWWALREREGRKSKRVREELGVGPKIIDTEKFMCWNV